MLKKFIKVKSLIFNMHVRKNHAIKTIKNVNGDDKKNGRK